VSSQTDCICIRVFGFVDTNDRLSLGTAVC